MCHVASGKNYDRPIQEGDLEKIVTFYDNWALEHGLCTVPGRFIEEVYQVILNMNSPQPLVLVALVDLKFRKLNELKSELFPWVALPYSALNYEIGVRLMSPEMVPFHGVFGMFSLAQRNVELLRGMLSSWGDSFDTFHDCGCFFPDADEEVTSTRVYQDTNFVRSHFEAKGGGVEILPFTDRAWEDPAIDMRQPEIEAYQRMHACLLTLDSPNSVIFVHKRNVEVAMVRNHPAQNSLLIV